MAEAGKKINWTDDQKKKIEQLVKEGKSDREIARIFDVNRTTIATYKRKWKLVSPIQIIDINKAELQRVEEAKAEFNQVEQLTHQLKYYESLAKKYQHELNERDWLISKIKDALSILKPPEKYVLPTYKTIHKEQKLVALFSDCQAFERIESEETNAFNYNYPIFEQRYRYWLDSIARITDIHRKSIPIKDLYIFALGDYLEGENIYFGQGARIQTDIIHQFFGMTDLMSSGLSELSKIFRSVNVTWLSGNHGRVFPKDQEKWYVNWEYVMGRFLQEKMKNHSNVTINVPMSWWAIEQIFDWKFYLTHGDELIRYMGVPWYSLERMDNRTAKVMQALGKEYQYMIIGHHHEPFSWDSPVGERICNGTFSYGSPYALKKLRALTRPSQMLFGVHPEWGISFRYVLRLDKDNQ